MLSVRRSRPRIPASRPVRPPDNAAQHRFFARNSQLLLVTSHAPRPQLAFLNPHLLRSSQNIPGKWHFSRLITTENKKLIEQQARLGVRYTIFGAVFCALFLAEAMIMTHELLEREFQTPHEWSMRSRCNYHCAKGLENPYARGLEITDWGLAGYAWKALLDRLEDPSIDGARLVKEVQLGQNIEGKEEFAYDVSGSPEPWRRGYCETLMSCAKAAEHLDGKVMDMTRRKIFPPEYVIGPSNPDPKPVPPWRPAAPLEEDCGPAYDQPSLYYTKILTSKGFTTRQQLAAALAYGDWLDFKGQHEQAEQMIRWGLDLACSALPDPAASIDPETAVLKVNAPIVTENLLAAATAFAIHNAQTSNTTAALPIFASILRARQRAPVSSTADAKQQFHIEKVDASGKSDISAFFAYCKAFMKIFEKVDYPPAPSSGDAPFEQGLEENCNQAALMSYVGEILFASSPTQRSLGLRWTSDAVELAEEGSRRPQASLEGVKKCLACLDVGLENWKSMVDLLAMEDELSSKGATDATRGRWSDWIPGSGTRRPSNEDRHALQQEKEKLDEVVEQVRRHNVRDKVENIESEQPLWGSWLLLVY